MTQLGCRIATTALSGSLSSRKARDLTGLIGLVVILLLGIGAYVISVGAAMWTSRGGGVTEVLATAQQVAEVLAWTPLGSPWAIMGAAGQGQWGMALVFFLLTVVYLIAGVRVYGAILNRALHASQTSASATEVGARNIVDSVTSWPGISGALVPVGAVMARALRYWRRDPRYLGQVPAVLMMPILFTFIGVSMPRLPDGGGQIPAIMSQGMIGFGLGFMALMAGYSLSADVASDSTAWWIHLASGVRGWQDRLGRILAQVMWMLPLVILVGVVVPLFVFDARVVPNVLGAMLVLYGAGLGVSAIFSALIIYPVALPGESPLKMKTGMMGTQMLSQFGSLFIGGIIALPLCIWAINAQGWQSWMVLGVSVLGFVTLTGLGVFFGGRIMDARGPAILSTLIKNDSKERS
jgi:ABC-2 type transport system permease protein